MEQPMKPELKRIIDAIDYDEYAHEQLDTIFLAALHWREGELWCGPISFGFVHENENRCGRSGWSCNPWAMDIDLDFATEEEAKAALMTAARKQITKWFKDQIG